MKRKIGIAMIIISYAAVIAGLIVTAGIIKTLVLLFACIAIATWFFIAFKLIKS